MPPQVAAPEDSDKPTKLKMASTTIATPISKVNKVISKGMTFGRISCHKICQERMPSMRADTT